MGDPAETIERARTAANDGDYAEALSQYDYFYDNALKEDRSYYGVRHSYCLEEWAELAEKYPPAKARLEEKMATALRLLDETRDPEHFHDYRSICHFLKCTDKAVSKFLTVHGSDPELAQKTFRFIRDDLVAAEKWDICGAYLLHPDKQYIQFLNAFDGAMKVNIQENSDEYEDFTKNWFVENIASLMLILKNTGKGPESEIIHEQFSMDMTARGFDDLIDALDEKIAA